MLLAEVSERKRRPVGQVPRVPVLLVCEKCEHRLAKEGMFRQAQRVRHAIAVCQDEAQASGSELRILPVSCLDVCPRGAMAIATGAPGGRGPAHTMVVRDVAELRAACERLVDTATPAVAD